MCGHSRLLARTAHWYLLFVCTAWAAWGPFVWAQQPEPAGRSRTQPVLPNADGQTWVEYDLRPYTSRIEQVDRPEQAIVDWILRETGTEIWFNEPLGFMSASRDTLRVYHVPEVQRRVQAIVERFVSSKAESYVLGVRLMTVGSPNWRAKALPLMRAVPVQSPGVDAWLLSKENAALLVAQLRKRSDYAEHGSPNLVISNGQSHTLERRQARSYLRSIRVRENGWPLYQAEPATLSEGYSLLLSPLVAVDGQFLDAAVKCHIDQLERFIPVAVDVPSAIGTTQRLQVEVPQLSSWRLHERFRWPTDEVLLLSCGVIAAPTPDVAVGMPLNFSSAPPRADALLLLDCKGKASQTLVGGSAPAAETARGTTDISRGRY